MFVLPVGFKQFAMRKYATVARFWTLSMPMNPLLMSDIPLASVDSANTKFLIRCAFKGRRTETARMGWHEIDEASQYSTKLPLPLPARIRFGCSIVPQDNLSA